MDNKKILEIALKQSALDYSFDVSNFTSGQYIVLEPKGVSELARNYLKEKPFCNFVYYGKTLVSIVDDKMKLFIEKFLESNKNDVYRVFDAPQITILNNELEKHGYCIAHLAQFFLPDVTYKPNLNKEITTKFFYGDEIKELYEDKRYTMALAYTREEKRRDEIALVAYIDNKIVGIAGASNDSNTMWQIGIDVLEPFRNQGIASTITYLLSQEILKLGRVPFYCCAWSNLASKNTARKAGFRDAWVELTAKKIDEEWIKKMRNLYV